MTRIRKPTDIKVGEKYILFNELNKSVFREVIKVTRIYRAELYWKFYYKMYTRSWINYFLYTKIAGFNPRRIYHIDK